MLRFLKIDLISACLAVASLFVVALPPSPQQPTLTASAFAESVQTAALTELHTSHHPLRALGNLGLASWYGEVLDGHPTASGEIFDKDQLTACHRTLPFGTMVKVTDVHTGRSVVVKINDRGVLFPERVIDLSSGAARELGILHAGVAKVKLEVLHKVAGLDKDSEPTHDEPANAEPANAVPAPTPGSPI